MRRVSNSIAPIAMGVLLTHSASFSLSLVCISALLVITMLMLLFLPETEGMDLE